MPDMSLIATGTVACVIAVILWAVEWRAHRAHAAWCAGRVKAEGVVSRIGLRNHLSRNEPTSSDEKIYNVAVVRFRAADGVEYEIDAPDARGEVGTPVQVAYDAELPSSARAVHRVQKQGCTVVVLLIGIVLIVKGFLA